MIIHLLLAYFIIALALPILSSVADSRGNKKKFMQFFTWLGSAGCIGLFWFKGPEPNVGWGVICFILAAMGYIGSLVFYNSYLPEIAPPEDRDWISARGYSMGYAGSVLLQLVGFGLVLYFSSMGDETSGPRYTFLLVGLWWIGFAQFTFARLPDSKPAKDKPLREVLRAGFIELQKVWNQVKEVEVIEMVFGCFFLLQHGRANRNVGGYFVWQPGAGLTSR
jgi:UMF1 family MFS transporter